MSLREAVIDGALLKAAEGHPRQDEGGGDRLGASEEIKGETGVTVDSPHAGEEVTS